MSNLKNTYEFIKDKQKQKEYNDEIVNKTLHYQKKFGFKTSSKKGNEFWNNEADAFKHAYSGADMYLKYGNSFSLGAGEFIMNIKLLRILQENGTWIHGIIIKAEKSQGKY